MFSNLVDLFYPRICGGCDAHLRKDEQNLCLLCVHELPRTFFWDYKINPIEQLFWGKLNVNAACAFLHFEKEGPVQQLMHRFKYQGKTGIGSELGRMFATQLKESSWFLDVDMVVPIPLHPKKEQLRGYNQSRFIADGMADVFGVSALAHALQRTVASDTQTNKTRFERAENVEQVFATAPNRFFNKTVLLVDDVVTTGSTLEAAGKLILNNGAQRLYIATLACA